MFLYLNIMMFFIMIEDMKTDLIKQKNLPKKKMEEISSN